MPRTQTSADTLQTGTIDPVTGQLSGPAGPTGTAYYGTAPTDERGRKYVIWPDGTKFYLRPEFMDKSHAGGRIHKPDEWNPKTGEWEPQGVDWGKLGPWLGLAGIGGVTAAIAIASSVPAAAVPASTAAPTAAGTGGTLAATTTVPTATGTIAGGTATGIGAGTAAGTAGATGGTVASTGGIVGKLGGWGNLIGIGSQFAGQYLQNRANSQATDKQIAASERAAELEAQSQREALDFAKAVYGREQEQLAPYVGAGGSAVTKLSQLMGLGTPAPYKPLPVQAPIPAAPGVMVGDPRLGPGPSNPAMAGSNTAPNGTLASLSGIGGSVLMQAPDGSQRQVPQTMVAEATAKGARVIGYGA